MYRPFFTIEDERTKAEIAMGMRLAYDRNHQERMKVCTADALADLLRMRDLREQQLRKIDEAFGVFIPNK